MFRLERVEDQSIEIERRRRWPRRLSLTLGLFLLLMLAALVAVWLMRVRLATDYIDREFARRGVQASYEVKRIGFGTQVLENLVIGDPRRPDLTARQVRVQILIGLTGPRVGLITARGVRMRGRIVDGRLTLGQIDRLLPPPSGLPFRLPDQRVDLADVAIALETPSGPIGLGLEGRGNLADGFRGRLAVVGRQLQMGECAIAAPRADVAVSVDDLRPVFRGPAAMDSLRCGDDLAISSPRADVDALLAPALDSWRGGARLRAAGLAAGPHSMAGLGGRITFAGDAQRTNGQIVLESRRAAVDMFRAAATRFAGDYVLSPRHGDLQLSGDVSARGLVLHDESLGAFAAALRGAEGTPIGPIGDRLADAFIRAARGGGAAEAVLRLANGRSRGGVRLENVRFASQSGADLRLTGGEGITYSWPAGGLRIDGNLALSGGGFPDARFQLSQSRIGAPIEGRGRIAPMTANGARLALGEIGFTAGSDGRTRFRTTLQIDGPFSGGRVAGLTLPLAGRFGRGGFVLGEGCVNASFRSLQIDDLRIGPSRLPLCPTGPGLVWSRGGGVNAGAELRSPRFAGRLGGSPVTLAAGRLRATLDGFDANGVEARLGPSSSVTAFDVESLRGRFGGTGTSGEFAGLSGAIGAVPFDFSEGAGRWRFAADRLTLEGRLRVADRQSPPRFHPLASEDFRLSLAGNRIQAGGWLNHPQTGTRVTEVTIEHRLGTGVGSALLDVPGIRFTPAFQPEALTPLTIGVVALVDGTVSGQGRIAWDDRGTRSTGTFSTSGMNFAAPFGPVEGLTTTIEFTDLLGLASAPAQVARIDLVRAGIDVRDGIVRYQLRPDANVAVESGRWPFAGGELVLQPTLLDFSRETTKYLTFQVIGLDAARFIQQMEFANIAATGTFDGIIPMQFDQSGGRIVGGRLSARPEGGTLSYVGELSDRDLGPYGILAFNALKSLRYSKFDLTLDGALAGEFVTVIDLDGIARDPAGTTLPSGGGITTMIASRVFRQVAAIPFEFNIRIQGQFRSLIATARSFSDPTDLIQSVLPEMLRDRSTPSTDVQDEESEPVQ
ncbi:MAG TPA: YdbH domain-containing protein [Allosphingosinicella sp.]|nr:YdbH domain-containing protein [Allosphingosinicella sp.]